MSKKEAKASDNIIYDRVNVWTKTNDENRLRRSVDRWTKQKPSAKEKIE
jgi:hypothetical protein